MFFRVFLLVLCLPTLLLTGSVMDNSDKYSKGPAPSWVKPQTFPIENVPVKPSQINVQTLLLDKQRHWEEKTTYYLSVYKILTQSGARDASQLYIDFDPSYSRVVVHSIRIFRDGGCLDRLATARHNLIQREQDLERDLYYGTLSLVYFIEDLREGDIIEYSHSLIGAQPLFASHYLDQLYLQRGPSVEKISYRLLGPQELSFQCRATNTSLEARIADITPSLREWTWEVTDTPTYASEEGEPAWANLPAQIQISQYKTWGEVAQKLYPLYVLPKDFSRSVPTEMRTLVEKWMAATLNPSRRALMALRFVQDEVRYLGIEEGMGAFQPTQPQVTFQRRFGDCKDKTFLLHTLLRLMDIPSTPLLVDSKLGKRLPEVLPTPFFSIILFFNWK